MTLAPNTHDLAALFHHAAFNEPGAVITLSTSYAQPVYRYLVCRLGDQAEAERITQKVFEKMLQSIPKHPQEERVLLLQFLAAAHSFLAHSHKRKSGEAAAEPGLLVEDPPKEQPAPDFRQALLTLPEDQREVLTLRFMDELDTPEVAVFLGKDKHVVQQLQARGLRALCKQIGEGA